MPDGILTHITQTIAIASPRVYIDDEKLDKQYDAYRCVCKRHSLLHTPGYQCNIAGLILDRASDVLMSCRNRLIEAAPFIISDKISSWMILRLQLYVV